MHARGFSKYERPGKACAPAVLPAYHAPLLVDTSAEVNQLRGQCCFWYDMQQLRAVCMACPAAVLLASARPLPLYTYWVSLISSQGCCWLFAADLKGLVRHVQMLLLACLASATEYSNQDVFLTTSQVLCKHCWCNRSWVCGVCLLGVACTHTRLA